MDVKEEKGITLGVLVITIIILIILAGVSISLFTGGDGLIAKAQETKINMINAQEEESELASSFYNKMLGIIAEPAPPKDTGATTHEANELTDTWSELGKMADKIASSSEITSSTIEVEVDGKILGIGDWLTVLYGTGQTKKKVRILGFNHDTLANDSSKKAGISFEFVTTLERAEMNTSATNTGGWEASSMRTMLAENGTLYTSLPEDLRNEIKTVSKAWNLTGETAQNQNPPTSDKLWLLSYYEILGELPASGIQAEGEEYAWYVNGGSRVKSSTFTGIGDPTTTWWLRSPCYDSNDSFYFVRLNGRCDYMEANTSYGVAPGFSI